MTPEQAALRREAISAAGAILARARQERDQAFADAGGGREGALAVGRAAHPRDEDKAREAAERYLGWAREEQRKTAPKAGAA